VYRVGTADTPAGCFETTHVLFSWNPMDFACTDGQVPKWTGTGWACGEDETGAGTEHTHTGAQIVDGSIYGQDLAPNSVSSSRIADNSVTAVDLASNSVGASEIQNGSVTAADLATNSVGTSELQNGSVTNAKLASDIEVRGYQVVEGSSVNDNPANSAKSAYAFCPTGKRPVGGGFRTGSYNPTLARAASWQISMPIPSSNNGWWVYLHDPDHAYNSIRAYAICVSAP
jgi:hypothetical protein